MDKYYVYIMSNERYTVLYTGFTNDLDRRMYEHKNKVYEKSFTKKYNVSLLLYYEEFNSAEEAKHREIQIKKYTRQFKRNLINSINPEWRDLSEDFK
jgi:putative endonuclease